jgi:hypothetical protein
VKIYGGATLGANTFTGAQILPTGLSLIWVAATSGNPALRNNGAVLEARLGDNSAYADFNASVIQGTGGVLAGDATQIGWSARTRLLSSATGKMEIRNAANTTGVVLDVLTSGVLTVRNKADSAAGTIYGILRTSANYAAGVITPTGSLEITDGAGTVYLVDCMVKP